MANEQNTSTTDTLISSKPALITDANASYLNKESYSHARNVVRNSKDGDLGTMGNEPSTLLCFKTTYKIIGSVDLTDDEVMYFSGDGKNSEIGIGSSKTCEYRVVSTLPCWNFNPEYPITGVSRKDFATGIVVYFTDKYNPVRRIQLNKLSPETTCEELQLFKNIAMPCITVEKGQVGNMPDGMYSVVMSYVVNGQIFSDWNSITNRIALSNENVNSLQVTLSGLDTEFSHYALAVVGSYIDPVTKGATKLAKQIGIFSTKQTTVAITDFLNTEYLPVPLGNLVIKKDTWQMAGIVSSNSNYLMFADLVGRQEENYQLKAMSIQAEYVVSQAPAEYYEHDGQDVGYYRDENYEFFIQGVYTTGEVTSKFQIPGRLSKPEDRTIVSSADVYEYDKDYVGCTDGTKIEKWQVENTAGQMVPLTEEFVCGRRLIGKGTMGYHQSTLLYPDNPAMYGEWANTPIRHHRMPDECKVLRYSDVGGKKYVNILGVRFKHIPKFDNPDIVGYKITRSDRKGGNGTVVARGLMTNLRSYNDPQIGQEILYSNYPVNNLGPDNFLSITQTVFKGGKETQFNPPTEYYKDRFTFFSPHTSFEPRYSLGTEIKIETEEIAEVKTKFEVVYNHPQLKLLNQFSFWLASAVGFIQSTIVLLGKTDLKGVAGLKIGVDGGPYFEVHNGIKIETVQDLISLNPTQIVYMVQQAVKAADVGGIIPILNLVKVAVQSLAALALKIPFSILAGIAEADKTMEIIDNFTGYTDYVYQINSAANFTRSRCVANGNKRRRLLTPALYIPSDVVSIDDKLFNNYFREKTVYFQLNKEISDPTEEDTTNRTMTDSGACDSKEALSTGSAFYVTNKAINPNQYGAVGSANPVSMHGCVLPFSTETEFTTSDVLFGGDCVITRFSFLKKMQFFNQNMANANFPAGTEYDYRKYRNIAYPRFWLDSSKFDFSTLLSKNVVNFQKFTRTTTSKHNLDCKKQSDGGTITRIDDAYMYLSNNTAMEFFVEADYNVDFREETLQPYYSKKNRNIKDIFRSDRLAEPEVFKINRVYSDLYTTEIFAVQQRDDYDPANPIPVEQPNSVIYSLPSFNLQNVDNWQYFLPANYFAFRESDFGRLTGMHKLDQDRIIFLFSKSSPYVSMGRDFLQLEGTGRKITIGDGGLFAQDPREIMPTDNNYGACNSKYAFVNCHLGRFYPSESQGRILQYTNNLDDITKAGISYWCKNYMPIKLYEYFPTYPEVENPISGVGYLSSFDSFNETVYITKRDFAPKKEYIKDITYDTEAKSFVYKGDLISVRNTRFFNDISWTVSYSPGDQGFVSWHDWHPDWIIQTDNHFMSVKDNGVWKHNELTDSFCKFYDVDYPFEMEFTCNGGQQIYTVRNLEYLLEVYTYKNGGRNRFHVLNENFDRLWVHNTEQTSLPLNLVHANPNPEENLMYPKKDNKTELGYDVTFFKEENKYRVNQFWDATNDRGEFTPVEDHLLATDESGYKTVVNPRAVDVNKPEEQRKKFRHYWTKFRLSKSVSGNKKFITKLLNVKKQVSLR